VKKNGNPSAKDRSMRPLVIFCPAIVGTGITRCALALATVFACEQSLAVQPGLNCEARAAASALGDQFGRDRPTQSGGHATQKLRVAGKRLSQRENCERWLAFDPGSALLVASEQPGRGGNAAEQETTPAKPEPVPPALQRVLDSWQAREESCRSLHVTWRVRPSLPKLVVGPRKLPPRATGMVRVPNVYRVECWLDNENRFCVETAKLGAPPSNASRPPLQMRRTYDGKTFSETRWSAGNVAPPTGKMFNPTANDRAFAFYLLENLVGFRPIFRGTTSASPAEFRLATENAIRDERRYVKLQRLDSAERIIENLWVDPARGNAVAFFEQTPHRQQSRTLVIRYERDPKHGWTPDSWFLQADEADSGVQPTKNTVIDFTINERIPPGTFAPQFPPGTTVDDETTAEAYQVAADGSKSQLQKFDSPTALKIHQVLGTYADFAIDPEPLKDALDFIATRYAIPIRIDQQGLAKAGINVNAEVSVQTGGLEVRKMLDSLLEQSGKHARFRISKDALIIEAEPSVK
jgi:hypothetical protein